LDEVPKERFSFQSNRNACEQLKVAIKNITVETEAQESMFSVEALLRDRMMGSKDANAVELPQIRYFAVICHRNH